jgi:hypothetical protein
MTAPEALGTAVFALALVHTFSTRVFQRLAQARPAHAGLWQLLAEVEVVFGLWAFVLVAGLAALQGPAAALAYLDGRHYTEPLFVFAIMVVAGSRAVLSVARAGVDAAARALPLPGGMGFCFVALALLPLLGSLITEPAAMTLAALMLRERLFSVARLSRRLKYGALGVLFVNVSIGGTLTPFAAPPVLMVAVAWQWDLPFMLSTFGWKAALATVVNAGALTLLFSRELARLPKAPPPARAMPPPGLAALHGVLLLGIVAGARHPPLFLGLLLLFMGIASAYPQHQDRLLLREGLLVAFFLAGLVVLGGLQQWWLEPLLRGMSATQVFLGAAALTAVTDNAALTYLGAQVAGLGDAFKVALVAGAVTGGGLTVIANAPNPAGFALLRGQFERGTIHPLGLLAAALPPTLVAGAAFRLL